MYLEHSFMQLPSPKIPNWTKQTRTSLFDEAQLSIKNSLKLARSQEFWVLLSTSFKRMEATEEQNSSATPKLILSKTFWRLLSNAATTPGYKKLSLTLFIFAQTRLFHETKKSLHDQNLRISSTKNFYHQQKTFILQQTMTQTRNKISVCCNDQIVEVSVVAAAVESIVVGLTHSLLH